LLKFNKFLEKVQNDWFNKNQDFYITQGKKQSDNYIKKENDEYKSLKEKINKIKISDIKFKKIEKNWMNEGFIEYQIYYPPELKNFKFSIDSVNNYITLNKYHYYDFYYKIFIAFINFYNKDEMTFILFKKNELLNKIINLISNKYYIIAYDRYLYLTKNHDKFLKKLKDNKPNIYFINQKVKGKEYTDYQLLEINKIKNKLKQITYNDITFQKFEGEYFTEYNIIFKNDELNKSIIKYDLISHGFFGLEKNQYKKYFGHIRKRFHSKSISEKLRGIGLGYKIYKSFIKYNGFIISDEQSSYSARKIYYYLLKDNDIYHILDKHREIGQQKILLIWKDYPKIKKLVHLIKTYELRNNQKYEYDDRLKKYF